MKQGSGILSQPHEFSDIESLLQCEDVPCIGIPITTIRQLSHDTCQYLQFATWLIIVSRFKSEYVVFSWWSKGSVFHCLYGALQCQATWLYLEPIFSSEDIMAQMPEEGRKFGIVDSYWKDIMTQAIKDANCLVATSQHNMLGRLNEANILLDEIQKGLNAYLEKKRLFFPRLVQLKFWASTH